jgi:hypothetical protein
MIGNDHVRFGPGATGKGPAQQAPRQWPTGTAAADNNRDVTRPK